jgi:predicted dehydrogenase
MTSKLNWGILGTGTIAQMQTTDLLENGFSVTAVGSRDLLKAQEFASANGIALPFGTYEDLVASPEVDVIYVATPHPFHFEHASLALEAGKHVLLEKPFAMNAREAGRLAELAQEKNLVLLEAMWTRFLPHMVQLRADIAAGLIGEVRSVSADFSALFPADPNGRHRNKALGGGALLDIGIYPVSFAIDLLGFPDKVVASGALTDGGVDNNVSMIFDYEGGQQALLHCAMDQVGTIAASVQGTLGRIDIDTPFFTQVGYRRYNADFELVDTLVVEPVSRGMQFQAAELERLVADGQLHSPTLPLSQTVSIMELVDHIRSQIGLVYPSDF